MYEISEDDVKLIRQKCHSIEKSAILLQNEIDHLREYLRDAYELINLMHSGDDLPSWWKLSDRANAVSEKARLFLAGEGHEPG